MRGRTHHIVAQDGAFPIVMQVLQKNTETVQHHIEGFPLSLGSELLLSLQKHRELLVPFLRCAGVERL